MPRREVTLDFIEGTTQGSTETLILSLVSEVPMYDCQLVKEMEIRSSGYFHLEEGKLYPCASDIGGGHSAVLSYLSQGG